MFGVGLGGVRCVFCRPCPVLCVVSVSQRNNVQCSLWQLHVQHSECGLSAHLAVRWHLLSAIRLQRVRTRWNESVYSK